MSATTAKRPGPEVMLIVGVVVAGLLVLLYFGRGGERPLERSAMGHQLVENWLNRGEIDMRRYAGVRIPPGTIEMRILPILDTDLHRAFERPETRAAYLKTGTEIDLSRFTVTTKLERSPINLLTPPKWQRGARHSGYAHASLLLDPADASRAYRQLGLIKNDLQRPEAKTMRIDTGDIGGDAEVVLYAPQLFDPNCLAGAPR